MIDAAVELGADGLVVNVLGAGHAPPAMADALARAAAQIPVAIVCRPARAAMPFETYAFEGSERDLRATAAVAAPFFSAPAARMKLLVALSAGLTGELLSGLFAVDDAQ